MMISKSPFMLLKADDSHFNFHLLSQTPGLITVVAIISDCLFIPAWYMGYEKGEKIQCIEGFLGFAA